jgi:thioredoxin-related protein
VLIIDVMDVINGVFMKRFPTSRLIMAGILLVLGALLAGSCAKHEKMETMPTAINFITDYDSALAAGQEKGQKVLIDFYAPWCQWCKRLDTVTYTDSSVIALSRSIVFAKIDAEKDTLTARKYGVSAFPMIVLMDNDGTEIDRIGGYLPPDEFLKTVKDYLQDIGTLSDYLRMADTNATIEVNYILAEKYDNRSEYDEARSYYEKVIAADPDKKDTLTAQAMLAIGNMLVSKKEYENSIQQYAKVINSFKDYDIVRSAEFGTAYAYRKLGDTATAIKTYENFLKKYPDSPDSATIRNQIEKLKNPPPPKEE